MTAVRTVPWAACDRNIIGIVKSTSLPPASVPTTWNGNRTWLVVDVMTSTQNDREPTGSNFGSAMSGVTSVVSRIFLNGIPRSVAV